MKHLPLLLALAASLLPLRAERIVLVAGGVYPLLFWGGFVGLGSLLPLALIYLPAFGGTRSAIAASFAVMAGALCFLYVFIIGGQAFPLELFPGREVSSSFLDGQIAPYAPSLPELLLGIGGVGLAFLITTVGVRAFDFLPVDDLRASAAAD